MKKIILLYLIFMVQNCFAQNTFPVTGAIYFDTSLKIGKQEAPSTTIGEINRLSLQPYGHTGGPWNFKARDNVSVAFLDIDYGITGSALTISSDKKIGVGTNNPLAKLHVNNGDNSYGTILANASEVEFSLYAKTLVTNIVNVESFRLGLKNSTNEDNGFISFYRGTGASGGFLGFSTNGTERIRISTSGNVGIGTSAPDEKLTVKGKIHTQEVRVDMNGPLVPDYVFANDYKLKTLNEVEDYIKENNHLPEIPSAKEIEKNGLMLAEMNMALLKKMEEMTLYMIEQNKRIEKLENRGK